MRAHPELLASREQPPSSDASDPEPHLPLYWYAHGVYVFRDLDEQLPVYEVGAKGVAPFEPPAERPFVRRTPAAGHEETLGWRPAIGLPIPTRDDWLLQRKLGTGPLGEVWLAHHVPTREQRVFKFCFRLDRLRWLKRERYLLERLNESLGQRDDIIPLIGWQFDRTPAFLEMAYVPDGSLPEWAEKFGGLAHVPLPVRLSIAAQVATAVGEAHRAGVLHKDIKPSNVLIRDERPAHERPFPPKPEDADKIRVVLADFGIGALTESPPDGADRTTALTLSTAALREGYGSPMYTAPELRTGGKPTTSCDVYALGVLLYQLALGDLSQPLGIGWEARFRQEVCRQLAESTTDHTPDEAGAADRERTDVFADLLIEDIKAAAHQFPDQRVASALRLAQRLRTLEERAQHRLNERREQELIARRERALRLVTIGLIIAFAFGAVTAVLGLSAYRQWQRAERAVAGERAAKEAAEREREAARAAQHAAEYSLYVASVNMAAREWYDGRLGPAIDRLAPYRAPPTDRPDPRGFEWYCLWNCFHAELQRIENNLGVPMAVAVDQTRNRLAVGYRNGAVVLIDVATGAVVRKLASPIEQLVTIVLSEDGNRLAAADDDGTLQFWLLDKTGQEPVRQEVHKRIVDMALAPDGDRLLVGCADGSLLWFDTASGQPLGMLDRAEEAVEAVAFSPDGQLLAAGFAGGTVKLIDTRDATVLFTQPGFGTDMGSVAFSPDGELLAACGTDGVVRVFRTKTGEPLWHADTGREALVLLFSPDGRTLVSGHWGGFVAGWNAVSGQERFRWVGHRWAVQSLAFAAGGRILFSASNDELVKAWDMTAPPGPLRLRLPTDRINDIAISPQLPAVAVALDWHGVAVYDTVTGQVLWRRNKPAFRACSAAFDPTGRTLFVGCADGTVQVLDAATGQCRYQFAAHSSPVTALDMSASGRYVATGSGECIVRCWDTLTGRLVREFTGPQAFVVGVAFSPDGGAVGCSSYDGFVRIWDLRSGRLRAKFHAHDWGVRALAFHPEGHLVATGAHDLGEGVKLWDLRTGLQLRELARHSGNVHPVAFDRQGLRVASGATDGTVKVFDVGTGADLLTLRLGAPVRTMRFDPKNNDLAVATGDGMLTIWRGGPESPLQRHVASLVRFHSARSRTLEQLLDALRDDPTVPAEVRREAIRHVRRLWYAHPTDLQQLARRGATAPVGPQGN